MKKTHRRMLLMCMVLCLAFVTGVHAVGAAESRQSGQWLYQIVEDGTAEILGYLDPDAVSLSVPAQLDDAWVTSIGEDAFAANTALEEITIPVQVASIAETAFSAEGMPVIRARNGSQALRYAQEKHFPTQNLSEFDFFEDVVDLSEMGDGLWSLQDGMLRLEEPFASLVEPGDELYLPARGSWSQGMPVRITSVTNEGAAVRASYAVLSLTEALASYQVEDVTLYPDYGSLILGEGVSLAPAARSAVSGDLSAGQTFDINKSFENGVTVTGRVGAMVYATASVDYEWLHVRELSVSLEEQLAVYLKVHYDGEEEDNASITRSFLLYRAPFLGSGLVGAWVDVYVKIGLSGEATLEAQVTTTQQLTLRDGDIVSKKCAVKSSEATVEANATLHGGVSLGPVLRLGFPGTENTPYIDLASFSIYGGIAGTASYTTEAPYCYDLNVKTEVSAEVAYGAALKVGDDEKAGGLKTAELGELSFPLWHKHWEGPDERWQDFCTYADLCTVSIYTGTDETMEPILVRRGEKIGAPKAPEREGYTFTGWYAGETLARAFDFTMPIVSDTMLYAGWAEDTPEPTPTPEPTSEPTSEPMPEPTPTESPTQRPTTAWYPLEDIPSAAETFDMCQIIPDDMDGDGTAESYFVIIPDGLSAVTLSKTYNGKPVTWSWSTGYHSQPIAAVTYTNEYTTITGADMPPYGARTVYLPDSVTSMEYLGNVSAIAHIRLSGNLRNIPADTFAYTGLEEIVIPDSVTSIGEYAFRDCANLQSVEMGNGVTSIGNWAFFGCVNLQSIVIPDSVTSISSWTFYGCSSLESVVIPDSVTSIGEYAFSDCENLQSVEMGAGVTSIGNGAFYDCNSLASVVIPDSVTSIGEYTFIDCENLQSVEIGTGVTSIGYMAFGDCSSLASVVIPDSVTSIGESAFYDCENLQSVEMGTGVTSIGNRAFSYCSSLASLVIPDSVTHIGESAFYNCSSLQAITLPARLQMMNSMLYGCESLTEIKTLSKDMTIDFSYLHFDGTNLKLLRAYEDSTLAEYVRQRYPHVRIVPPDMEGYFVSFETQRGTQPADLFVAPGELIPEPETPVWDSRVFEGWYKDWLRTEPWNFASDRMPSEDITLYAKWSYRVTGTIINRNNRSYLAPPLVDPEEDLSIPQTIGTSVIVGLMPDLVPAGVKTVHLSGLIEDIRPGAFRLATDLTSITVDEDNTHYYAVDGVLYASDGTLVCYPAGRQEASFEVPSGTTQIEEYAFSNCGALEELTFPESLKGLSAAAIHDCNALQRVTFAADPLQIGESNFLGSAKLRIFGPTDAGMLSAYAEANALSYNEYRLIYCSEGVVLAEIRMAAGEPLQLIGGPERAERILLGWSEDAAAQAPTDFSQAVMPARDLMLHAVWGYAFNWQEDGDGVELLNYNGEQKIIRVPETVDGKLVTAIADGAFDGLKAFTLEGNRGSVTEAYAAAKGYAFLPLSHTLRFESNGGTQLPPQTLCATDAVVIPACVRTGYDLTGWYTDGGLTQRWTGSTMPTNDLTLYAGWQPNGQTPQEVPFTYRTAADGIYITGYTGEAISVSVPAEINGVSVVGIDEAAFAGNTKIQNLYLPSTVNSIGAYAFQGMTSMTNISLPSQVSVLPKGVFQGCSFLSYMYIPDSVQRIESAAFKGCSHLEYVTIPLALESLASDAFTGCDALEWFDLYGENPYFSTINGVLFTDQGTRLLMYPRNPNVLYEIPSGVTAIDAGVRFPTQLEYLIIPDSVTELSVDNFAMRSSHLAVQVEPGSAAEAFFVENLPDVELTYEGWPAPGQGLHIVVPWDEVFQVGKPVQFRCTLDGVELEPDAVTWSVDQPEIAEITADGVLTFHHAGAPAITATLKADPTQTNTSWPVCYSDEGIWLPVGLKEIEDEAFCGSPMEEVDMPDGLERVGSRAFADCPWLFGVFVPNSVEYIADDAFSGSPYVCIYAEEGSYAIEYAQRMNLNFSYVYSVVPSL